MVAERGLRSKLPGDPDRITGRSRPRSGAGGRCFVARFIIPSPHPWIMAASLGRRTCGPDGRAPRRFAQRYAVVRCIALRAGREPGFVLPLTLEKRRGLLAADLDGAWCLVPRDNRLSRSLTLPLHPASTAPVRGGDARMRAAFAEPVPPRVRRSFRGDPLQDSRNQGYATASIPRSRRATKSGCTSRRTSRAAVSRSRRGR